MKYKVKISNFTFGVSIGFLGYRYNPNQFEIVGMGDGDGAKEIGIVTNYRGRTDLYYTDKTGKPICPYKSVLIKFR